MKKFYLLLVVALVSGHTFAQKQGFLIGPRVGIGVSQFRTSGFSDSDVEEKIALAAGLSAQYNFLRFFGVSTDVSLLNQGARVMGEQNVGLGEQDYTDIYNIQYIEVPLALRVNLGIQQFWVSAYAGPSYQFNIAGNVSRVFDDPDVDDNEGYEKEKLRNLDAVVPSAVFGLGLNVLANDGGVFFMDLRSGLQTDYLGKVDGRKAKIGYWMISFGKVF